MQQWQPNLCKREKLDKWGTVIWLQYCPTAIRSWPALQVAEVQQVKLPVVLRVIDGVHILGETLSMSAWHPPHIVHSHIYVTFKHTHSNTGTAPQLLPTALPPCSWCHYSRTEQRKSLRSLLRKERGRNKQKRGKKELMRTAASFSSKWQKREENTHRNICPNYQSFICVTALKRTSGRAFVKYVCQLPLESAKWCTHAHICVWLPVYACVQIPMFDDNVSFTAGPLCLHWSLGAGWILPAALWKVTVWMTDGRAANIKETQIL